MFTSQPKELDTIVYYQRSAANLYLILNYQNDFTLNPQKYLKYNTYSIKIVIVSLLQDTDLVI